MKHRIYVASSWRNRYQPGVVGLLRMRGHEVYDFRNPAPGNTGFAWSDVDPDWQAWETRRYIELLGHPIAQAGFKLDFDAMKWATAGVLVLPCGRSAHLEAGWFLGAGKPVVVYIPEPCEPELMYLLVGRAMIVDNSDDLLDFVAAAVPLSREPRDGG